LCCNKIFFVNLGICVTCWDLCAAFEPILLVRCGLNLYVLFENAMVPCKKTLDFTEWKIWSLVSASLVRYEQKARKYVHKLSYQLCAGLFHSIQIELFNHIYHISGPGECIVCLLIWLWLTSDVAKLTLHSATDLRR